MRLGTGAERREGRNASGARQLKLPRASNFFSSCLSRLRWEWLLLQCKWMEIRHRQAKQKYCARGFHKLTRGKITLHSQRQQCTVEYLACAFCEYKFFSTVEDKRIYLKIKKETRWPIPGETFRALKKRKKERIDNAKKSK